MSVSGRGPVRIANFCGYLGDRYTALDEALAGDPVDVLMGDYLAEYTLAILAGRARAERRAGYVGYFRRQLRPHLGAVAERGLKVVTNAGGFDPAGLADVLRDDVAAAGLDLQVAHVEGDNIIDRVTELRAAGHGFQHLDTGAVLADWGHDPVAANAYLGGWGIAAALGAGADIVVCGRVTDASLTAGPAPWWHSWAVDDWAALAGAVVAGYVIECGPQATGGNFAGFTAIPGVEHAGFPIAEVAADGSSVITKHARDGGAVTVDTVTAQIVYEIQGPRYLNPDVTAHLDTIRLASAGPDRVAITGVEGSPPPTTTKVALFAPIGYQFVQTVYVTAPDVEAKTALLRRQVAAFADASVEVDVTRFGAVPDDPATQWAATTPVRIMATAPTREALAPDRFGRPLGSLYLGSFPGLYTDTSAATALEPTPRIDYWPAVLPIDTLAHRAVRRGGDAIEAARPPTAPPAGQPAAAEPEPFAGRPDDVRRPLGDLAYARSGDKGGNSNVGVWVPDPAAWEWLRGTLSTAALRQLLPEVEDLEITRHEFPRPRAVHFVLHGLLGRGGSSNLRVDPLGKAVGEYLRAKHVSVPAELRADPRLLG